MRNSDQRSGDAEDWISQIDARHDRVGGFELNRGPICYSVVGVVEPAAFPAIGIGGVQIPDDGRAAHLALPQHWIGIVLVSLQQTLRIERLLEPDDMAAQHGSAIEDLNRHLFVHEPCADRTSNGGFRLLSGSGDASEQQDHATDLMQRRKPPQWQSEYSARQAQLRFSEGWADICDERQAQMDFGASKFMATPVCQV